MSALFLAAAVAAAAVLPPPLTEQEQKQLRCVAILAIVADEQKRGMRWREVAPVAGTGAKFAGLIGDRVAAVPGRSVETVRDWMIGSVAIARREGFDRAGIDLCLVLANIELADDDARRGAAGATK